MAKGSADSQQSDELSMVTRLLAACAALIAGLSTTNVAEAWEIKSTGAGESIRWPAGEVVIDLSMGAEAFGISEHTANDAVLDALHAWSDQVPDSLEIVVAEPEEELLPAARDGLSVIRWGTDANDAWVDPDALATTYLTYRTSTGQVTEADIVVNAVNYEWTVVGTSGCNQRYDLQNILTHEAGHFLGLSHATDHKESTMYPSAGQCEVSKRQLSDDDMAGIVFLYENLEINSSPPTSIAELANCSAGGKSGFGFTLLVGLAIFLAGRKKKKIRKRVQLFGLTQERAMTALSRTRIIGGVRSWMTIAAMLLVAWTAETSATTLKQLSPGQLVSSADVIVEGRVVSQRIALVDGFPTTFSTVAVSSCQALPCRDTVVVAQHGGEVGDIGLIVSGVTPLHVGENVLLFLRKRNGQMNPVGMNQGVFHIGQEVEGEVLYRDFHSTVFINTDGSAEPQTRFRRAEFDALFPVNLIQTH